MATIDVIIERRRLGRTGPILFVLGALGALCNIAVPTGVGNVTSIVTGNIVMLPEVEVVWVGYHQCFLLPEAFLLFGEAQGSCLSRVHGGGGGRGPTHFPFFNSHDQSPRPARRPMVFERRGPPSKFVRGSLSAATLGGHPAKKYPNVAVAMDDMFKPIL